MQRRHHRRRHLAPLNSVSEIDITPLIDLAFSLLIIFMIATPLLEQTIPLDLPHESARPQTRQDKINYQVISIDAKGDLFWGTQKVNRTQLDEHLSLFSRQADPSAVLHIRGDRHIDYGQVMDIVDLIKAHQLTQISLDTQVH